MQQHIPNRTVPIMHLGYVHENGSQCVNTLVVLSALHVTLQAKMAAFQDALLGENQSISVQATTNCHLKLTQGGLKQIEGIKYPALSII